MYIQYYTVKQRQYYYIEPFKVQMQKIPLFGVVAIIALHSKLIPCWKSTDPLPQATGPTPIPSLPLFPPHKPTHVTQFLTMKTTSACQKHSRPLLIPSYPRMFDIFLFNDP
jgi:hypothetical protein